jgi:hypothetical protein
MRPADRRRWGDDSAWMQMRGLSRPLDPSLPSNRIAIVVPGLVGAAGGLWALGHGATLLPAAWTAVQLGGGTFLAWATAREIDPDHPAAATLAALLLPALALLVALPHLGTAAALMYAARVAVRSTGQPPDPLDVVLLAAVAAWAGHGPAGWVAGLTLAVVVLLDGRLRTAPERMSIVHAILIATATIMVAVSTLGLPSGWSGPMPAEAAVAVLAIAAGVVVVVRTAGPASRADRTDEPLRRDRLRAARVAVVAAALVAMAIFGGGAIAPYGPALAAMVAVAAWTPLGDRVHHR